MIVAFVNLAACSTGEQALESELRVHIDNEIGQIVRSAMIRFSDARPKTRSGQIMRRILRALAAGKEVSGDISAL